MPYRQEAKAVLARVACPTQAVHTCLVLLLYSHREWLQHSHPESYCSTEALSVVAGNVHTSVARATHVSVEHSMRSFLDTAADKIILSVAAIQKSCVLLQEHVHTSVAHAINASVEHFVSPFLDRAADVMESASDVMERLPSTLLDKAFSKSLDVVTPFERMAR